MATILLSAAGAAVGAGFGGSVLGLSGAVIGRAIGATLGRAIDQRLLGAGSESVETGRVDRFRLTGASEGAAVGQVWGRMRVGGQVIWASRFKEHVTKSGGGKGVPSQPSVKEYSYTVSLAVALCEGEIARVGRIWADGVEISPEDVVMRVYTGGEEQLPDPLIEAIEGEGNVPAYRGTAYVVFEDLELGQFGNRVPQFSFEVVRRAQGDLAEAVGAVSDLVRGVALIPGTGEYSLATTPVHYSKGLGQNVSANVNSPGSETDLTVSLRALDEELPNCGSVSLVVSWFGDDLRCGQCSLKPKVEDARFDGVGMPWRAGGIARDQAEEVVRKDGRPVYGGTPADAAVVEAIEALKAQGKSVVFYPFILMEQMAGNGRPDPWTGAADQPELPWRGRITLSVAAGREESPDGSVAADAEVAAFFGSAKATDFSVVGKAVSYGGPDEWSYRRFILHYAHLCAAAGGVDAFCIGSEMRGLTQIRGAGGAFVAVEALRALAADVRAILGPDVKIGYAADWSEYFGYRDPAGDLYYHLDPLWADGNIDFVGIDNYMPISDWREGDKHADAGWGSIYNLEYLKANVVGGEGYDWYYASDAHRDAQIRTPIVDGAHGEDWVWRYKDIRSWWENEHFDRVGGQKGAKSPWVPRSKPIWFTELGCAAIDKGTNQPNRFWDPKSSESGLPYYSDGRRDDLIQAQYLRAVLGYWSDPENNPISPEYGGRMIDLARAHVWAWDARPFPWFPNNSELWADGDNYARGHWLNGRVTAQDLGAVVAEICQRSGLREVDVSGLHGLVRGYVVSDVASARAALQPLMLAYGFDAVERDGALGFRMRDGRADAVIDMQRLAHVEDLEGWVETARAPEAEIAGRVQLSYVEAEGDFEARSVEAILPDEEGGAIAQSEIALALTRAEARRVVERWLAEARVSRDGARFALPLSMAHVGAGDVVDLGDAGLYRVDRVERAEALAIEAVRVEPGVYMPSDESEERVAPRAFSPAMPVFTLFLDLPLMSGQEVAHAPHVAITATPWPGSAAIYASDSDDGYSLNTLVQARATIGQTETALFEAAPGVWDRGAPLRVKLASGSLSSASEMQILNGANLMAIGDGSSDRWELFQFRDAVLVGPDTYELSMRLRGQAGTDAVIPQSWPPGSYVVLINGALKQIELGLNLRDLARHYRIGPAARGYDDPAYEHRIEAFAGIGLRPYSVAHLRLKPDGSGGVVASWVRRTRIGGDSWSGLDVPLGEAVERYLVRVVEAGQVRREVIVGATQWSYSAAERAADGVAIPFEIHVAQLSDLFGPGPFRKGVVDV
ncbi:putative tail protein [Albidovulum inexpectatum]|uniref:Putative tail protein n=1 Tax=Albidovulum inexpectatum TaxID=196587 RepID=A0A2S5JIL7_9RHOB|nr:glycoside hydrolase TIM-barrel-like domain-containing protein [Albidovulum inexpectatum]PPB81309.1 putative tail protein [Albidovulum inexpectatum]